ncbi:MAG: GTPase domain-containing protein, partial [Natronospirillum sp.]
MQTATGLSSLTPHLCVVGHPNKGKSSIVSTLAEDDTVCVGAESGTTRTADTYEFMIADHVALALTDTPGFQRPRQVLAWLEAESVPPAARPERVRAFLAVPEHQQQFSDEVALLTPIMNGAGILYVVDASQAVTASDEAEMEILRWTGQPRMAVINPMGAAPATAEWQRALSQFFQWVRVFNPLSAALPARLALLRAVGELTPAWHRPVARL